MITLSILKKTVRAIGEALYANRSPHVVVVMGPPKAAKKHVVSDIVSKLYYGNPERGIPGSLQRIGTEEGYPVPIDIDLWGYSFSVAKYKGRLQKEMKYGQFGPEAMNIVTDEFEGLVVRNLEERQYRPSLIFLKVPAVTMAEIDGQLYGRNRAYTTLKKLARKEGPFADFDYRAYWIGEVSDPEAQAQGDTVRPELEEVAEDPDMIAQTLTNRGELILTANKQFTGDDRRELKEYVLESANPAASEEIRLLINGLAVEMAEKGRLRLNKDIFFWDDEAKGWRVRSPGYEMRVTAMVMREVMEQEENFGLSRRIFLGRNNRIREIVFDLRVPIRNTAMAYYPEIRELRNK